MKDSTIVILALSLLISWENVYAQRHSDSVRIVNEALKMIDFPEPIFESSYVAVMDSKTIEDIGFEQPNSFETVKFKMRDGVQINGQRYAHNSNKTLLLLHGVLSSSYTFNRTAGLLRENLQAEVIAIDLRGHGQSGGMPGDVSGLNQYAEDLDDIINSIKKAYPDQVVILSGHSMGGGIVLRHAESFPETKVNGYILFAPNLGPESPTTSKELDLKNNFVKIHLSRGLGLSMLNEIGIHSYDSLKVVFYNLPDQMPIRSYSYRSMEACVPEDYRRSLQAINQPLFVLAGSNDEAFLAEEYPKVVQAYSSGECFIVNGETHNGIRHNETAMTKVREWAFNNKLR